MRRATMHEPQRLTGVSGNQRAWAILRSAIQISLFVAAQRDITRRPATQIRGDKRMWRAISFVTILGPLAYFALGIVRRESVSRPIHNTA
ncbi:MAG: hypothetical protein GX657_03970 [Chloroflexi bacterium]|nr:hypothetical protein [Chloroflexota bacterium]